MAKKKKDIIPLPGNAVANPPILTPEQLKEAANLPVSTPISSGGYPQSPPKEQAKTTGGSGKTEVFRNEKGNLSAAQLPDGRIFLGLSPDDVRNLAAQQNQKQATPPGAVEASQAAAQRRTQSQEQQMLSAAPIPLSPDGRQAVPDESMLSKGATGAAAFGGAVFGAKAGAAVGTLIAPGIGTAVGGIIGGVGGAVGGAYTKMTIQKRQDVKESLKLFSQAKKNKQEILNMINAGLLSEGQARELWQEEKQNIAAAHSYLKRQTQNDLTNFIGNPGDELIQVESYIALDNYYDLEFEKALLQPNPAMIRYQQPEVTE